MTDVDIDADQREPRVSSREKTFEVVATLLLSLAALSTAWTGYQASLWNGIQSSNYTQASAARTEATQARTEANQYRLADLSVFENYIDARLSGADELASFYSDRFTPEFDVAFTAWWALSPLANPDAPASPLAMSEYQLPDDVKADTLEKRAGELFQEGEDANTVSDVYTMSTVLFALVLFFAAVSERFEYVRMRVLLLTFAAAGLIAGVVVALGQPITSA